MPLKGIARSQSSKISHTPAYTLHGHVIQVQDGDSFVLRTAGRKQRIRLASIDAPESAQPARKRPGQAYAKAAHSALAALIEHKTFTLACFEPDTYGRHVCDVPLEDGTTANQQLVSQGMAWANRQQARFLRDPKIARLEQRARAQKRGLWRDHHPMAPWIWRVQCWQHKQCATR